MIMASTKEPVMSYLLFLGYIAAVKLAIPETDWWMVTVVALVPPVLLVAA